MMSGHDEGVYDTLPPFLARYGYAAETSSEWKGGSAAHPQLQLRVQGHEEAEGHTFYVVECSLVGTSGLRRLDWSVGRRLCYLRDGLHDPVKEHLGGGLYEQHFAGAPFAHKGGLPGTTSRLNAWSSALASCVNARGCQPRAVAVILHFLEVPEPRTATESAKSTASSVASKVRNAAQSFATQVQQAPDNMQRSAEKAAWGLAAQNPKAAMSLAGCAAKGW